mgnify:CR=1 FL=1
MSTSTSQKIINVTVFNIANKIIKDLFVQNVNIFVSYRSKLTTVIDEIKKKYERGSIRYYHSSTNFLAIDPFLMEITGDSFNHFIYSINSLILNICDEIIKYADQDDDFNYMTLPMFKNKLESLIKNTSSLYEIQRDFVSQGSNNISLKKDDYTLSEWILALDNGIKLNDTVLINLGTMIDTVDFLKGYRERLVTYTGREFNINELDYDQYMELAMSEAEFTKFQLQMYTDVRKKLFLMLKFANVRFANYMKVLEEVNSTLDANYGGA